MMKLKSEIKLFLISFGIFFIIFFLLFLVFENKKEDYSDILQDREELQDVINFSTNIENKEAQYFKKDDIKTIRYRKILNELKYKTIQKEIELNSALKINYIYNPENFEQELIGSDIFSDFSIILSSFVFDNIDLFFDIEFNKYFSDTRGRYKDKIIKLFGILNFNIEEIISVFIHELGHYVDINFFQKQVLHDLSDKFYQISWEGTKILKAGQVNSNFVSGYAMTNKYEDFAESFVYYILHNSSFYLKTQNNEFLKQKYDFFTKYIFNKNEFKDTNFAINIILADYYWDITKIEISLQNLLNYLKKSI